MERMQMKRWSGSISLDKDLMDVLSFASADGNRWVSWALRGDWSSAWSHGRGVPPRVPESEAWTWLKNLVEGWNSNIGVFLCMRSDVLFWGLMRTSSSDHWIGPTWGKLQSCSSKGSRRDLPTGGIDHSLSSHRMQGGAELNHLCLQEYYDWCHWTCALLTLWCSNIPCSHGVPEWPNAFSAWDQRRYWSRWGTGLDCSTWLWPNLWCEATGCIVTWSFRRSRCPPKLWPRPIKRSIVANVETPLAQKGLSGEFDDGDTVSGLKFSNWQYLCQPGSVIRVTINDCTICVHVECSGMLAGGELRSRGYLYKSLHIRELRSYTLVSKHILDVRWCAT